MISYLHGKLAHKSPTELIIDVNGVGYAVHVPLSTYEKLGHTDGQVKILTYMHVREDVMQLYGFATEAEREAFRLLISISGIGPKMAQGILSGLSTQELREAIIQGNIALLTSIPGVGRKTSERIILELRDKFAKQEVFETPSPPTSKQLKARTEAIVALMSLGYTRQSAERAVLTVLRERVDKEISVEELIKLALRHSTT
ncbi:MAG: Holliday junction branch migration protein RuvA [Ignavibacteriae bacterium]|nr:Holliday junction branch migration protein RuvA [Ignavibacteriota bacterium]